MFWRLPLIFTFAIGCACAQVQIPNTPAGLTLRAWLEAFHSGDHARMEAFLQKYGPRFTGSQVGLDSGPGADGMMRFHDVTGSLEFLGVDKITPAGAESSIGLYTQSFLTPGRQKWTHIEFRVQQKASLKTAVGELDVMDTVPAQIVNLNFKGL
jgi:hypothetical protein